ncbi:MAG: type I glyceraldehyde-3-phosphate dehydrogenase [Candidatus Omnitrophica bacterium]|nr:type I glyceraldehyde-3-phosphate dehydrogenase [Candidatus Omnitrophota bacterium]MBI2174441.1 type I glyceraldehyde-3-phosphate dehydrogenase [Candidatus Omnitrophota bacterium]MBI3009948.1 type I glyceraldehyde-3-phosphate dehydrogenase [Candidatus Omnitrophota bacterium]
MAIRIGINGFGRIGRNVLRAALNRPGLEFVALNDLPTPPQTLAHLLKYDSILGPFQADVAAGQDTISVNGKALKLFTGKSPAEIPWDQVGVDLVIESTGAFTDKEKAAAHLTRGVKKVVITAPAKNEDITIVMGVNDKSYDPAKHHVVSNASCTTNCVVPMAKLIHERFTILRGFMTTIHSYTNDQRLLDLTHKDLRRARAAALSMIPSTTGAAKTVGVVFPELKGKIDGLSIRVPTPNVSIVDLSCQVEKATTIEEVNGIFKAASEGPMKRILQYCTEPLVSKDFNGNPHSCIFDATMTAVIDKHLVKAFGWYDNEWGYSNRVVDLIEFMVQKGLGGFASTAKAAAVHA